MGLGSHDRVIAVLLVEDDSRLLTTLVSALTRRGHVTEGASTVTQARELLQTFRPDACIVDMKLPDGSGLDLIRELRAKSGNTHLMLITGYGSLEVGADAIRAGANEVISKPATISEIIQRLHGGPALPSSASYEIPSADRAVWEHVRRVLKDCGGNKSLTARKLGVDRGTLQRWLDRQAPAH